MERVPASAFLTVLLIFILISPVFAQQRPRQDFISMKDRLNQIINVINSAQNCETSATAVRLGMETLYGGLRPVPSRDRLTETIEADRNIAEMETALAGALQKFAASGKCTEAAAMALDLKLFIEQMNEVAVAVGRFTIECGVDKPCEGLIPVLDEETGHEDFTQLAKPLKPGFSIKLRSPFVPWNVIHGWEEDVMMTNPIPLGSCVGIFKETRGLMLKLRLVRIDVVRDPWATPMLGRGTKIPVWALEWVPSQYGKTWNICNIKGSGLQTTVTQRVKQDVPLNYFWRYYGSAGHSKKK